jgi:hypothetical protein
MKTFLYGRIRNCLFVTEHEKSVVHGCGWSDEQIAKTSLNFVREIPEFSAQ